MTEHPGTWENEQSVVAVLYDELRALSAADKDGIWAQIIANAYAPLFAGYFDVVVGNPPWLAWGLLPDAWRRGSERLWQRYGLWRSPSEPGDIGGVQPVGDIAQLVYAVAVDRYAANAAFIGLLTPAALLIANPGARAFRQFRLKSDSQYDGNTIDVPFAVCSVDDWSEIHPFAPLASNKPVFIVARKAQTHAYPVTGTKWQRTGAGTRVSGDWREVRALVSPIAGSYSPANPTVPTSAWSFRPDGAPEMVKGGTNKWDFGVGLHTRGANGVFFVRITRNHAARGLVEVENLPSEGRNSAVSARRGLVESDAVYPLLRGRDVSPWRADPSLFIVVPHMPSAMGQVLPSASLAHSGEFAHLGSWLRQFRAILKNRSTPPNRNWKMDEDDWCRIEGPMVHIRGDNLVVVREIAGRPAAAVVQKRLFSDLGRSEAALADHKLLFCSVPSEIEAGYLTAFINSTPAQDFLASFASATGVTPRAIKTLPIPDFDSQDADAVALVSFAQAVLATRSEDRSFVAASFQQQMDECVVRLSKLNFASYAPQPRRRLSSRGAARPDESLPGLFPEDG